MTVVDKAKTVTEVAHAFLWCLLVVLVLLFLSFQSARKYVAQMAGDAPSKAAMTALLIR
jgi:hypothetical protein